MITKKLEINNKKYYFYLLFLILNTTYSIATEKEDKVPELIKSSILITEKEDKVPELIKSSILITEKEDKVLEIIKSSILIIEKNYDNITDYKNKIPKPKTSIEIEQDINKDTTNRFSRQMGSPHEKRTFVQFLLGRNEDQTIRIIGQKKGVSEKLSTGRNFLNLSETIDQKDKIIDEMSNLVNKYKESIGSELKILQEKITSAEKLNNMSIGSELKILQEKITNAEKLNNIYEVQFLHYKEIFEEVKKSQNDNISNLKKLIEVMEDKQKLMVSQEKHSIKNLLSIIQLVDPEMTFPEISDISLLDATTVVQNMIREKSENDSLLENKALKKIGEIFNLLGENESESESESDILSNLEILKKLILQYKDKTSYQEEKNN